MLEISYKKKHRGCGEVQEKEKNRSSCKDKDERRLLIFFAQYVLVVEIKFEEVVFFVLDFS